MSTWDFDGSDGTDPANQTVAQRAADARPRQRAVITGTIRWAGVVKMGPGAAYTCVLDDSSGEIDVVFVGRNSVAGLVPGACCTIEGTVNADGGRLVVWNPLYRIQPGATG